MGEVVTKMVHQRAQMWDNTGGELDHAVGIRRNYKKDSSVLPCIGKTTSEGCDLGSEKSGQFTADGTGKGQFLREN